MCVDRNRTRTRERERERVAQHLARAKSYIFLLLSRRAQITQLMVCFAAKFVSAR